MRDDTPDDRANALLGFPPDARLLILNGDDFGMYHAINVGIVESIKEGVASSCSLMVPCPWALHAMELLRENPEIPFGVHLTLICDTSNYRWGTLIPKEKVRSLLNEAGELFGVTEIDELMTRGRLDEMELEFRAQIEAVVAAELEPTHLDWHCLHDGGREDVFDLTTSLAKEHGLAVRSGHRSASEKLRSQGLPATDHGLLDSFELELDDKSARYAQMLRELPVGLSEWAVHPGLGNDESQAIDPGGWRVRRTDYEFLMSPQAREIIQQEGIEVLDYRPLQAMWRRHGAG
jgi:predicted glycoside hydrolase/deacetylase ChbG (UPF0249 family)